MTEANTKKSFKQKVEANAKAKHRPMNRQERRQHQGHQNNANAKREAIKKLEEQAKDAVTRGQLLNEAPKMVMTPESALEAFLLKDWPLKEAVQKVVQIYKEQFNEDIENHLLDYVEKKMFGKKKEAPSEQV